MGLTYHPAHSHSSPLPFPKLTHRFPTSRTSQSRPFNPREPSYSVPPHTSTQSFHRVHPIRDFFLLGYTRSISSTAYLSPFVIP